MTTDALLQALAHDVGVLRDDFITGRWQPSPAERDLAEALARGGLSNGRVRTELRAVGDRVHDGRLVDILSPAAALGELTAPSAQTTAVLSELRLLLDAVAGT
ncbi:hypothetical protein OG897_40230 [Streptomyces sp. NBC_00237]|uniref:hypothetical protein n=1 Tax=Streptomyces sp. NBC_00237 TaxID=2975687 RepID=UPI0022589A7F|nr:hypothetical protein [Streptomyces sp. NBC_00237]MCX5207621.1 hypothetical protein [Streptomyces sp. NBC_00237]